LFIRRKKKGEAPSMPFWKVIKIHWDEREPPWRALTAAPNGADRGHRRTFVDIVLYR